MYIYYSVCRRFQCTGRRCIRLLCFESFTTGAGSLQTQEPIYALPGASKGVVHGVSANVFAASSYVKPNAMLSLTSSYVKPNDASSYVKRNSIRTSLRYTIFHYIRGAVN